jgi:hypothetical protein
MVCSSSSSMTLGSFTSEHKKKPELIKLIKIIFLCLDHEMETREPHLHNGLAADMDKAETCGALKLTAADATDEDGSPQPVSEILQRIWDICEFIEIPTSECCPVS